MSKAEDRRCDECGSGSIAAATKMAGLCNAFADGRCSKCGWDGSVSDFLKP